ETTTTISSPLSRNVLTFAATCSMRSTEPTEVPPNFCTINAISLPPKPFVKKTTHSSPGPRATASPTLAMPHHPQGDSLTALPVLTWLSLKPLLNKCASQRQRIIELLRLAATTLRH